MRTHTPMEQALRNGFFALTSAAAITLSSGCTAPAEYADQQVLDVRPTSRTGGSTGKPAMCRHAGGAGGCSVCRTGSATRSRVSLPDSLISQAISAPPAYNFKKKT
jgi:hypothetical protein